ncbi:MAG: phosphatidylcholine synthase [Bowdeniella nasicola]|nr:phosphatidylcholine synthase [Bowdeniella nasicola]
MASATAHSGAESDDYRPDRGAGSVYANARGGHYPHLTARQACAVWGVHLFTMTGVVWACLATISLVHANIKMMWLWLGIALVVDGIDGTLARRAKVRERVPWFDGAVLDNIVDYITWTFIPAVFMYKHLPLGPKWLAMSLMILIATTSTFTYCNTGEKSHDNYFVGFPAAWNVVAVYMWLLHSPAWVNILAILVLAALTMSSLTFLHPFRVRTLVIPNIIAVTVWLICLVTLIVIYPTAPLAVHVAWWLAGLWLVGVGIWRTVKGERTNDAPTQ